MLGVYHQLAKGAGLHLWVMRTEAELPGADADEEWRLRLDLDLKL